MAASPTTGTVTSSSIAPSRPSMGARRPPLDGIRVLDLTRLLPGDFATWVLADLGAEVIKIEDTVGGDYMRWMPPMVGSNSAMFWALNRGKRCVRIDLKTEGGKGVFLRLLAGGGRRGAGCWSAGVEG